MDGCKAALPLVEKLADGEASPNETREAEAHLASCPDCREHLEALTAFARLSSQGGLPEPPESYWEHLPRRILERIDSEAVTTRSFWRKLLAPGMLRLQAIVVSCVLLVAVGVTVFRSELRDTVAPVAAPPPRPAPAPAAPAVEEEPAVPAVEEETLTEEGRADLQALGYLQTPPIARDESPQAPAAEQSEASKRANAPSETRVPVSPASEALPSAVPVSPAPQATGAREKTAEVTAVLDERVSREEDSFRSLKQKEEPEQEQEALRSRAAVSRALSVESAEDSEPCAGWRRFLETYGDEGARGADARYELARCSIRRYEQAPLDASREMAIADAEAFLAREPEGPRAEEIRKSLEAVRH